jgi:hypothetical protein
MYKERERDENWSDVKAAQSMWKKPTVIKRGYLAYILRCEAINREVTIYVYLIFCDKHVQQKKTVGCLYIRRLLLMITKKEKKNERKETIDKRNYWLTMKIIVKDKACT